jgi:hypothetical protein
MATGAYVPISDANERTIVSVQITKGPGPSRMACSNQHRV